MEVKRHGKILRLLLIENFKQNIQESIYGVRVQSFCIGQIRYAVKARFRILCPSSNTILSLIIILSARVILSLQNSAEPGAPETERESASAPGKTYLCTGGVSLLPLFLQIAFQKSCQIVGIGRVILEICHRTVHNKICLQFLVACMAFPDMGNKRFHLFLRHISLHVWLY